MVKISSVLVMAPGIEPDADQREVLCRELERGEALISGNVPRLDALIADDLVHIHGNGKVEGKAEYLEGVRTKYRFHRVDRDDLRMRSYGSVMVLTGPIQQDFFTAGDDRRFEVEGFLTQIWLRSDANWRQNTYHMQFLKMNGKLIA